MKDGLDDNDVKEIIKRVENGDNQEDDEVLEHNESAKNPNFFNINEEKKVSGNSQD